MRLRFRDRIVALCACLSGCTALITAPECESAGDCPDGASCLPDRTCDSAPPGAGLVATPVINEVYYNSPGTDVGTFIEIKGAPGTNLSGFQIVGSNTSGTVYATIN